MYCKYRGILAQVGGNEFALLLMNTEIEQALLITQQFRNAVNDYQLIYEEGYSSVSFYSGIVPIDLQEYEASRLLQTASAACHLAKGHGVNQQHVIKIDYGEMEKNSQVIYWASAIDDKLKHNSLMLRYQPIVPIEVNGLQPHAEILLGVTDHKGNLVSPEHFILAAERYQRMPEVDRWVIKNTLSFFKKQPNLLGKLGGISINSSGLSINDESIIPFIIEQLQASHPPPHVSVLKSQKPQASLVYQVRRSLLIPLKSKG